MKDVDFSSDLELGRYRHFKGMLYDVVDVARHSESLEFYVVYRALYGEGGLWIRPLEMFKEQVTREGKTFPRFEKVPNDTPIEG